VAIVLPKFSRRGSSTGERITRRTEPAIGLRLLSLHAGLEPGDTLDFEFSIHRVPAESIDGLEASVLWTTEGKGSEDIGVHFFERLSGSQLSERSLQQPRTLSTKLPLCPLSYEGRLMKIRWCVRLRLFLKGGREISAEQPFYLGHVTREV
jgi:hypothetical protein